MVLSVRVRLWRARPPHASLIVFSTFRPATARDLVHMGADLFAGKSIQRAPCVIAV
jgi:hypothetical protein